MATYDEIYGKRVEVFDSDPTLNSSYEGQVWYDSANGVLKTVVSFAAWSSSTPTSNTYDQNGGCGTQTAALTGAGSNKTSMEEYNGIGWTAGGAVPAAQELQSQLAGTQTAAIMKSGLHQNPDRYNTEAYTYNGTSWSSIPAAPGNRVRGAAAGTTTAFLCAGGASGPPTFTNRLSTSVEYNGSSWTAGGALSTARAYLAGLGIESAAIMAGGAVPPSYSGTNVTEQYDGSSFSSLPNLNTARHGLSGAGTTTANVVFGGGAGPPYEDKTESYDGSSWTVQPTMGTGRTYLAGAGATSTAAVAMAGYGPSAGATSLVEEYNISINTITPGAWASGGALPAASMRSAAGAGTQTAGLIAGGYTTTATSEAYLYDGSTWTATGDLPAAREGAAGCGTQTAGFSIGGKNPPSTAKAETYTFGGSSWTAAPSLPTATGGLAAFGTTSATAAAGGSTSFGPANAVNASYEYNGSSWTAGENINTARNNLTGFGTQTAGAINNGYIPGGSGYSAATEEYDGTDWTTGNAMIVASSGCRASGASQTDAILFSGRSAANNGEQRTFGYDGTTWSSRPSLANNHYQQGGAGTSSTTTFLAGGGPKGSGTPDNVTNTEQFTPETIAITSKTLTTG